MMTMRSLYYDLIIIHVVIVYAYELHCKHHTRMTMNKFHFNEHKQDTWKCDWLIGHIISISLSLGLKPITFVHQPHSCSDAKKLLELKALLVDL